MKVLLALSARSIRGLAARAQATPGISAFLLFALLYLCAIQYYRRNSYRDPTSFFFDPTCAYKPEYSPFRQQEANAYINASTVAAPQRSNITSFNKTLCVGIASVARDGVQYFRTTVGSVLDGLSDEERQAIYLILFIAHTDPTVHPAYSEGWMEIVSDKVLIYDLPEDQLRHTKDLEKQGTSFREKGLFDYMYLLKACSTIGAPFIAILEDDVIAQDGWYHRTMKGLELAKTTIFMRL